MSDEGPRTQTDLSISGAKAEAGGQAVSVRLIGYDQPFFTAVALVLAVVSLIVATFVLWDVNRITYFTQRCEAYVEQAAFDHKVGVPYAICGARNH